MNVSTQSPDYNTALGKLLVADQPIQFRNLLDGGDYTVNPWQRNIPGLASGGVISSAVAATVTYFADRFFAVGGASSSILMAKVAESALPGFASSLKISRTSANANTAAFNLGQVIETLDSIRCQGQIVTLSFWAKAGANYSGGAVTVALNHSTTAGNDTAAHLVAASTNWQATPTIVNSTFAPTATMVRYSFCGLVPAGCTQLGLLLTFAPTGTAGSDDSLTFNGFQLEVAGTASVTAGATTYVPSPSNFEHRDAQVELEICQRYAYLIAEPAAGVIVGTGGAVAAANSQIFYMALPVQMMVAPTVTVAAGTFKVCAAAAAATATGIAAGTTHTVNAISITSTVTQTVGLSATLQGGGGSGYILASADL